MEKIELLSFKKSSRFFFQNRIVSKGKEQGCWGGRRGVEPQLCTASHTKKSAQLTEAPLLPLVVGLKMPARWRSLQISAPATASKLFPNQPLKVLLFVRIEMPNVPGSLLKSSRKGRLRILYSICLLTFSAMVSTNHTHSISPAPPAWGNYLRKLSVPPSAHSLCLSFSLRGENLSPPHP